MADKLVYYLSPKQVLMLQIDLFRNDMILPEYIYQTLRCEDKSCSKLPPNLLEYLYTYIDGDIMIYAFVGIYRTEDGETCSTDIHTGGYQEVESLVWTVNQINNDKYFLHNIPLGLIIFDTCALQNRTEKLIESILRPGFILSTTNVMRNNATVLGVIGGPTHPGAIGMELGTRIVDKEIPVVSMYII